MFGSCTNPAKYDPEDRLTVANQQLLLAGYDGDGLRAWSDYGPSYYTLGTPSYYLYDGDQPVTEDDYAGEDLFYTVFGAAGMEGRYRTYAGAGGGTSGIAYSAYTYDPQGNLVQPVVLLPFAQNSPVVRVQMTSAYDAFGGYTNVAAQGQFDQFEPVGFGGQYGYYREYTGLYELTHRYYDPTAGRFVTRDPIGYGGGINLYGLAGNNPVNGSDPSGFDFSDYVNGMGDALNPIEAGKGLISFGKYLLSGHASGRAFGKAVLTGLNPVDSNATDRQQGQRVMSDGLLLVAGYGTLSKLRVLGAAGAIADATGSGGSLVRNGLNLSRYVVVDRMGPRGITEDMIKVTLRKGQPFWDPKNKTVNYILQNGMASGKSILVGQNPLSGKVTTAMTSSKSLINKRFIPIK